MPCPAMGAAAGACSQSCVPPRGRGWAAGCLLIQVGSARLCPPGSTGWAARRLLVQDRGVVSGASSRPGWGGWAAGHLLIQVGVLRVPPGGRSGQRGVFSSRMLPNKFKIVEEWTQIHPTHLAFTLPRALSSKEAMWKDRPAVSGEGTSGEGLARNQKPRLTPGAQTYGSEGHVPS